MTRTIWITRTAPGADATAGRVAAMGFTPLVAALLATRPVGEGPVDLNGVGALAFTSAQGVAAFAARSARRRLPVFTVGSATARAARSAGFDSVASADGDVTDLAALIAAHRPEIEGEILHPAGAETIGELPARKLVVYESTAPALSDDIRARLPAVWAALVYSPKAGRALAGILEETPAPDLRVLCLSPAVAAPLAGAAVREIATAALPNEQALLNLLVD